MRYYLSNNENIINMINNHHGNIITKATYRNSQQQKIALFNKFIKQLCECFINKTQFPQNKKTSTEIPFSLISKFTI